MDKIKTKLNIVLPPAAAVLGMLAMAVFSSDASRGAYNGLSLCAKVIIPSLFPFFAVSSLLVSLGVPYLLGKAAGPVTNRLFGVSGAGAAAFVIGLIGGYPLGAAAVYELYRQGCLEKRSAERLLAFCNNTGPAFIFGAAGSGIFGSFRAGAVLYCVHAVSAVITGLIVSAGHRGKHAAAPAPKFCALTFSEALVSAVKSAVSNILSVCGFVIFFSAVKAVLEALGIFNSLAGQLAAHTGLELTWCRALLTGLLEIGGGISALAGLPAEPLSFALCAFILGWGGLSVHCQTMAVTGELSASFHFPGKVLHALLSAVLAFSAASLII